MPQIVVSERFVGQRAAEAKRDAEFERRFARGAEVDRFDDPDHLVQYHAQVMAEEQARRVSGATLRAYINFWSGEKRKEIESHKAHGCYVRCETCLLCVTCRVAVGQSWRCTCSEGTKMLSPWRRVFLNNSIKSHRLRYIWSIGEGWVPREVEKYGQSAAGLDR